MADFDTASRNTFIEALDAWNSGTLELQSATDAVLASISIPATGFGAATGGSKEKSGTWQGVGTAAAGTGTQCTKAQMIDSSGATITLTAGPTGGGAEVEISNNITGVNDDVIVEDNSVVVTALTATFPASS